LTGRKWGLATMVHTSVGAQSEGITDVMPATAKDRRRNP